jgi:hypothetical protein
MHAQFRHRGLGRSREVSDPGATTRRDAPGKGAAIAGLITSGLALVVCVMYVVAIGAAASTSPPAAAPARPTAAVPAAAVPARSAAPAAPAPAPAGPLTTFSDGTYQVGVDIAAGRYKTPGPDGNSALDICYWQRSKDDSGEFDALIANEIVKGPGSVTVKKGEFASVNGGCVWTKQ